MRAKIKVLTKQIEEDKSLRTKMTEQVSDLQRQLKAEREDSKNLKKRIQILELDSKKSATASGRRMSESGPAGGSSDATIDTLTQEVNLLKKDLATAERLAKQAEANCKTKDALLKRSAETITRMKEQQTGAREQSKVHFIKL
jgi:chromosome segregation ATPase